MKEFFENLLNLMPMQDKVKSIILNTTNATNAEEAEEIQELWSGYGKIVRVMLTGAEPNTIILKNIILPETSNHPRGWDTNNSHQRKLKSYQVEMNWYDQWSKRCDENCRVPESLISITEDNEFIIALEDLDAAGYPLRKSHLNLTEVKLCVTWLAQFHATFIGENPKGLWEQGSYWHLETRPDEYNEMKSSPLKSAAHQLDDLLNNCTYKTIIHGDAKVANFCFSNNMSSVAAVDFQYVGGGCGMKDLVYLLGSCLTEENCELLEEEVLLHYFSVLVKAIHQKGKIVDVVALEKEWRRMFPIAWTDFSRFLIGWMPTHQKINGYTQQIEKEVLNQIKENNGGYKN